MVNGIELAPPISFVCLTHLLMEEKQVSLRWVSPQDVFNLPLYENYLVIDTRSTEDFMRGSIATAVSYPAPDHTEETEEGRERSLCTSLPPDTLKSIAVLRMLTV